MPSEGMTKVVSKCSACFKTDEFEVPSSALAARGKGVKLHDAFPDLPMERRLQLVDHVCPACREQLTALTKGPK